MRANKLIAVIKREYLTRIKTRGFWISTALFPLFMLLLTVVPALVAENQKTSITVGIQDHTGRVAERLLAAQEANGDEADGDRLVTIESIATDVPPDSLEAQVLRGALDAFVILDEEAVTTGEVEYHAQVTTNFQPQRVLRVQLREAFDADRLSRSGFDPEVVADLLVGARLVPRSVGKVDEDAASGESQFILAMILFFVLYTMLLIHGQQILRSVLEEKSSRIVEVVISSLRPDELLGGKLIGVGAIAMTQLLIWILCGVAISGAASMGILAMIDQLPRIPVTVVFHLVLLFLTGFAIYATLYASVGAMHSNEQEAQQYNFVVMMPLILAAVLMPAVLSDPSGTMAVVGTFIPLLTPLVLMGRIAVDAAPGWQIGVAYAISAVFVVFEVWLAAKIYRVGIIMYGKRPTIPELMRWIRH